MFKKLSDGIFALALVAGGFAPAQAQDDTIAIYFDNAGALERYGNTSGAPFDIVVGATASQSSCASEFVMTELTVGRVGLFKLDTAKINNTPLDLGDNSVGEYIISYGGCVGSGFAEIVRLNYLDTAGALENDIVMSLRGLEAGDSFPSSFGGEIGYITSTDENVVLAPLPWVDGDIIEPTDDPNTDSSDGVCVLNAQVLPNEVESVSSLKARF
jgi:hypothetical protein